MKTSNNLKDLNITLAELYEAETKQIEIHLSDKPFVFHVVLKDRKGYDCKISSFGANLYARTNKGVNCEQYKNLSTLQTQLTRLISNKVDTNGIITFKISDEVYTF